MELTCNDCHANFDDAERSTICPHPLIMPREDLDRKILALTLIGQPIRFRHYAGGQFKAPLFVESIAWDGMVTLRGLSAYGQFAPHLFALVEAPREIEQLP